MAQTYRHRRAEPSDEGGHPMKDSTTDREHVPVEGPMNLVRWSDTSGYQFCSCGIWHFVTLEPTPAAEIGRSHHAG